MCCQYYPILLAHLLYLLVFVANLLGEVFDLICQQFNVGDVIDLLIIKGFIVFLEEFQSFCELLKFGSQIFLIGAELITQVY